MSLILIKNTTDGIQKIGIGYTTNSQSKDLTGVHELTLKPGLNEIDAADWEKAKKLDIVNYKLEIEEFIEIDGVSLAEFGVPKALKLVRECNDKALLDKWSKSEKRPTVVEALAKQAEKFKPPPPKRN